MAPVCLLLFQSVAKRLRCYGCGKQHTRWIHTTRNKQGNRQRRAHIAALTLLLFLFSVSFLVFFIHLLTLFYFLLSVPIFQTSPFPLSSNLLAVFLLHCVIMFLPSSAFRFAAFVLHRIDFTDQDIPIFCVLFFLFLSTSFQPLT